MLTFPELARVTAMTAVAHGPRRTRQRRRTRPRAAEGSAGPCAGAGVACAPASHPVPAASSAPLSPASGHTHASPGQTWVKGQEARKEQDSGPQPLSLPVPVDPRADLREPSRPGFTSSAFSGHQASLTPVPTQGELRISVLPAYLSYDAPWPVRKIPLRCTAHYVAYHVESKVYAVATSTSTPCTRVPRMTGEEKEFETIERDERYVHPQQEAFCIQLISPVSWEAIPNARIELEEWEHVTCMKTVSLRSEETVSGLKGYVAAGTCLMQGEEVTCRGRILIMDVIEVVPEPGQPLTKNKFKVLYEKEQKGPVTALCHCNGHLVSAIGQKIFLWSLRASELTGMAFIDTQLYIHQMISVKNFILAADVMKSISLLRYQEESKTLSLVSRDAKPLEVYSVDFMVDNAQLGFLVSDRDRNLMVYMYLPEAKESFGGMRLLRRADFHVGAHVNTFWRTPCRGAAEGPSKKSVVWENKHITWFATLDGGIGLLLPMQEKTYRRLLMLQNALTTMLPHHAGLNPRAFRMLHVDRRVLQNAVRNVLDGELLNRYLYLSTMERGELAKKIGTTPDIILDDLLETDRVTAHF